MKNDSTKPANTSETPTETSSNVRPVSVRQVIRQQSALITEMHEDIKKIRKKLFWMTVGGYIKLVIIILPIIVGAILLSPYVRSIIDFFSWGQGADIIQSFQQVNELLGR